MGVKVLLCFPFNRRSKDKCKNKQCTPETVSSEERKPRLSSTTSVGSKGDNGSSLGGPQVYYSQKARVSFRHRDQMDSNINAVDATY